MMSGDRVIKYIAPSLPRWKFFIYGPSREIKGTSYWLEESVSPFTKCPGNQR
jgi:hypothetical protein